MPAIHPRIQLLPDYLINQIAAGEVIERPASVVKELLDNTLDAGAGEVVIEIERGGTGLIKVRDNGCGIQHEDLELAITRHATSKIRRLADLQSIMTLGFRGEALPSIGSISRMSVTSRAEGEELAWTIRAEGRTEQSVPEPASHPAGTTIEVRDLFFNTPARRKYLRTERTEFYQIQQVVRHFAIAHPQIGIKLSHNRKSILNLKADNERDMKSRVEAICGKRFIQNAVVVEQGHKGFQLQGWTGLSEAARTINDSQFFCLNGRCIRDKRINHAVTQAYQNVLPEGRYGAYALYLSMDPTELDVNVHPAKTEVRFRDGRNLHDFIYSALHQALQGHTQTVMPLQDETADYLKETQTGHSIQQPHPGRNTIRETVSFYQSAKPVTSDPHQLPNPASCQSGADAVQKRHMIQSKEGDYSGQIGKVVVIRTEEELILVDKLAVHCVFLHEQISTEGVSPAGPALLFPITLKYDKHIQMLLHHQEVLLKLGFDFRSIRKGYVQLRRVPSGLASESEIKTLLSIMASRLDSDFSDPVNMLIKSVAEFQAVSMTSHDIALMLESMDLSKYSGMVKKLNVADLLQIIKGQS